MSEATAGAMADACQEARWLSERLGGGKGLVSGGGQLVLTFSYARPGRGGEWRTPAVAEAEAKKEVGANCEEVK